MNQGVCIDRTVSTFVLLKIFLAFETNSTIKIYMKLIKYGRFTIVKMRFNVFLPRVGIQ